MYDVAIIGAGVIGSSIARELSRHKLNVVVLEKEFDVAIGSSKANSGIVHGGYDCKPGTLKAKFNVLGNPMFDQLSEELDFHFKRNGSLVLGFEEGCEPALEDLMQQGVTNGVPDLRIIDRDELVAMEPNIGNAVFVALYVPTGGIVCPYGMTIAFAENAADNGVEFRFNSPVEKLEKVGDHFLITSSTGQVEAKIVINAAGLYSDVMNNMVSEDSFVITPRRGEYSLLDRTEGDLIHNTLFQLPSKMGKGVLVTPTVDGNILIGPTSEDLEDKEDVSTTRQGQIGIIDTGKIDVNYLPTNKIITSFAGLRARGDRDDFIIGPAPDEPNFINVAAIESPGLTSAPAIAVYIRDMVADMTGAPLNETFNPIRRVAPRFRDMDTQQRIAAIAENPDYGHIVCRCETVTKAEVVDALRGPLHIRDMDSIKRRTRTMGGRCQGGFCSMRLPEIISQELNIPITEVTKAGPGTNLLVGKDKANLADL